MKLTPDQQVVADAIFQKLFEGKDQEIILSGPAGTGKSFLLNYLIYDMLPRYQSTCKVMGIKPRFVASKPYVTATTNKAVGVLDKAMPFAEASTIESAIGLTVSGDYTKGEYTLKPSRSGLSFLSDSIVIIDEASMIDPKLHGFITKCCIGCFIIYVGDDCQLPAVKSGEVPYVFSLGLPEYKLTSLVRQAKNQEIANLCNDLRNTVKTEQFPDIVTTPTIMHVVEPEKQQEILKNLFQGVMEDKILTYTNNKAIQYNEWIMEQKHGFYAPIYEGETYIVNEYYSEKSFRLQPETEIVIDKIQGDFIQTYEGADCEFIIFEAAHNSLLTPKDKTYFKKWLSYIAKHKDWKNYFKYKESVVDIRGNYASTIHKAQGSTFDNVIIDATDLKYCNNNAIAARLLYVAVSRAKGSITFFGNLPKRYGAIQ